jgi:hypothetical protein
MQLEHRCTLSPRQDVEYAIPGRRYSKKWIIDCLVGELASRELCGEACASRVVKREDEASRRRFSQDGNCSDW